VPVLLKLALRRGLIENLNPYWPWVTLTNIGASFVLI
jgi:hypothetical protein